MTPFRLGAKEVRSPSISFCVNALCAMGPHTKLKSRVRLPSHNCLDQNTRVLCPLFKLDVIAHENTE